MGSAERPDALGVGAATNVMRPDQVHESLPQQAVLTRAPDVEDERFRVPRILSED